MRSDINGGKPTEIAAFRRDVSARTAGAVAETNGGFSIADTATTAKKGDIFRAETGVLANKEIKIISASTNSFVIASKVAPSASDTFYILAKATPRVGSDGSAAVSQSASSSASGALSRAANTALATSLVIKAGPGRLYSLLITNTKATAQFIQIHNTTSLPSDTAVPIYSFYVQPNSSASLGAEDFGDYFSTGITVCNSSTAATKTIGSADCWFTARYL